MLGRQSLTQAEATDCAPKETPVEAIQKEGKNLMYLVVQPDDYQPEASYPAIIMLHGFGANMGDLANLAPYLHKTGYLYICPNAPFGMQMGPDMVGFAWYLPSTVPADQIPPDLPDPEALLAEFFQEIMEEYRLKPGNMVLLGFSQGGRLTYSCGLPRADLFAGIVALSCPLGNLDDLRQKLPPLKGQQIFIAHGAMDNPGRAQEAKAFLEQEGYRPWYKEYPMGHEISQEVLNDLAPWLQRVLPPRQTIYIAR